MPFIEELLDRTEYAVKWINSKRSEVYAYRRLHDGERISIGCCFVGNQEDCRKYVGGKIGGLTMSCGRLYNSKGV
jgi:hypothetical protein